MKTTTLCSALIGALLLSSVALPSVAGDRHTAWHTEMPVHAKMTMKMFKGLELTAAQESQLKDMFAKRRQEKSAQPPANRTEFHQQLQQLVMADQFDKAAAQLILEQQQESQLQRQLQHLQFQHQLMAILTPEQKTLLQQRQAERRQHKKQD